MDYPVVIIPIVVVVVLFAVIYSIFNTNKAIIKRKLRKIRERIISEVKDGDIVKIKGKVQYLNKTIQSPMYNIRCAHYYVLIEEEYKAMWTSILEKESSADIVIYDGRDYAVIQTKRIKSHLVIDNTFTSNIYKSAPEKVNAFMYKNGLETTDFLGYTKPIRYKECVVEEDDLLTIVGKARWAKKEQLQFEMPAEKVLYIGNNEMVYITDDPKI